MQARELRQKNRGDLMNLLLELRREQFNLRMQQGSGQTVRPSRVKEVRKEIARIKTVMNEQIRGTGA